MKLTDVFEQEKSGDQVGYPASEIIDRIRATDRSILAIYHGLQAIGYEGIGPKAQGQIIKPYGKEISAYLDEMLSGYPRNPRVIAQGLQLLSIGIRWPELRSVLEKHKNSVLWYILSRVKDSVEKNTYEGRLVAKTVIESLKDLGITWSEFDAILKSIDAPKQVTENDQASDISNEVYYMLQRSVERMDIWYVLNRMIEWKLNFKKIPQARELFDTRKNFIVKELLTGVKAGEVGYSNRRISSLHTIGVDWPELDIIQKSILADRENRASIAEDTDDLDDDLLDDIVPMLKQNILNGIKFMINYGITLKDVPLAGPVIDRKKDVVLTKLLKRIKSNSIDDIPEGRRQAELDNIQRYLNELLELGIIWPELDIIQKSILADSTATKPTPMNENTVDRGQFETDFEGLVRAIKNKYWGRAEDHLYKLRDWYEWYEVIQLLGTYLEPDVVNPYFEHTKTDIMQEILGSIKDNYLNSARNALSGLIKSGVNWPELAIIKRSLDAEKSRTTVVEDDDPGSQEDFVKHSVLNLLKNNNPGAALNVIYAHYTSDPRNLKWLKTNITPILLKHYNKKKLLQWVAKTVNDVTVPKIVSARNLLKQLGVELPDIKTIIDDNKDHVMKRYLQIIKNYKSVEPVIKDIQHLHELGITWPELDVIEKSLQSDKKLQEETEDDQLASHTEWQIQRVLDEIDVQLSNVYPSFINWVYQLKYLNALPRVKPIIEKYKKNVIAYVIKRLKEGKVSDVIELENILAEGGIRLPELDNIIENNKELLVKTLLTKMKNGQKDTVNRTIHALEKLNVKWPELAIIQKSIQADINK